MTTDKTGSHILTEDTQSVMDAYQALDTDAKLALLYFIYEHMGESVTPAAPTATEPNLAPHLLGDFLTLSSDDQLTIMRDIVNNADTEYSRAYGALTANNQLMVWYAWAQEMGTNVVDMPNGYQSTDAIRRSLSQLENLDFEQQISTLREIASRMGHSEAHPIPTQAETGKTPSL